MWSNNAIIVSSIQKVNQTLCKSQGALYTSLWAGTLLLNYAENNGAVKKIIDFKNVLYISMVRYTRNLTLFISLKNHCLQWIII